MGLLREFKEFAMKGNVIDLAVGIIIGAAFGKIVDSLVKDVIMPPLGILIGKVNFTDLAVRLGTDPAGKPVLLRYGAFLQEVFNFLIIALAVFLLIKIINEARRRMERKAEEDPKAPEVPADIKLLTEIRDELRIRRASA
jgi:large conductance mechanosensitive channel